MNLLAEIRNECRARYYSPRTASVYCAWTRALWRATGKKSPRDWNATDVRDFLVAMPRRGYSAVSQKQALNAIVFCFRHVRSPLELLP